MRPLAAQTFRGDAVDISTKALFACLKHPNSQVYFILQREFVASLPGTRVWDFENMAGVMAYAPTIRDLASAAAASTGYGEASHKAVKPCVSRTSRH